MNKNTLKAILLEGEGLSVEFKESLSNHLDREIVAFANAEGGSIFLGVNDNGEIVGIKITNKLTSQIQDIARNCDPSINIKIKTHKNDQIVEIFVPKGIDKPYRCADGFFLRNGPNSQKLKRDEIIYLMSENNHIQFDNSITSNFTYKNDFSENKLQEYLKRCGFELNLPAEDILISLNVAKIQEKKLLINNTGALFFSKNPQKFFPESFITCVKYKSYDRFSIIDKKDMLGSPIEQIEAALLFLIAHVPAQISINLSTKNQLGMRHEIFDYPLVALREAIINSVAHRDYLYNASHIYIHFYPDHIDIENPGGLYQGLTLEMLGKRSVRRNPLIADLLHRAKYIERVGSGIDRIKRSLTENNNPSMEIQATNFFNIRFYPRINEPEQSLLTSRQLQIYRIIKEKGNVTRKQITDFFSISDDTAIRELNALIEMKFIVKHSQGKSTFYKIA